MPLCPTPLPASVPSSRMYLLPVGVPVAIASIGMGAVPRVIACDLTVPAILGCDDVDGTKLRQQGIERGARLFVDYNSTRRISDRRLLSP